MQQRAVCLALRRAGGCHLAPRLVADVTRQRHLFGARGPRARLIDFTGLLGLSGCLDVAALAPLQLLGGSQADDDENKPHSVLPRNLNERAVEI